MAVYADPDAVRTSATHTVTRVFRGPTSPPSRPAPLQPSATLVVLRDGRNDVEVLLLRRGRRLSAFAGIWVFPGGAMEDRDGCEAPGEDFQAAARQTAVRELNEETGLSLPAADLVPLARWTAPVVMPRRFDTWFFLAAAPRQRVQIDNGEIRAYRWIAPGAALGAHRSGDLPLFPPTWVTLYHLRHCRRVQAALADAAGRAPFHYAPKVVQAGPATCFLYGGDAAYTHLQLDAPGPRHRLWVRDNAWHLEMTAEER